MNVPVGPLKSRALPLETLVCLSLIACLLDVTILLNFVLMIPLPSCMASLYMCISLAMYYFSNNVCIFGFMNFTSTETYRICLWNFFLSPHYFYGIYS